MRNKIIFCLLIVLTFTSSFADRSNYQKTIEWSIKNDHLIVTHFHDWSTETEEKRVYIFYDLQNPFSQENDYSYIECHKINSNDLIFKVPSIALTYLYISPNSEYIVGLSKIKFENQYQIIILNLKGEIIFKKHIAVDEAFLSNEEFAQFRKDQSNSYSILSDIDGITIESKGVYIDFIRMNMDMPRILGSSWEYLLNKVKRSHLSKYFWETTSNFIFWYKEPDPEIQLKYENGIITAISLLDPAGERFEIEIKGLKNL